LYKYHSLNPLKRVNSILTR